MNLLDELGVKWKREHHVINNNLFCTVSIWDDEIKEWVSRQDVGTESNTEAAKGEASDSFKRACFNWGIGRELYSAPFIWIAADYYKSYQKNGKYGTYDKFEVKNIEYVDKEITNLTIINAKTKEVVYSMNSYKTGVNKTPKWKPSDTKQVTDDQRSMIANLLRQHGIDTDNMKEYLATEYGVSSEMSQADAQLIIDDLNGTENK